jgi:3-deoxy-manno-octulosonate cytidylyltransferase (CMP-KDO synthetase)
MSFIAVIPARFGSTRLPGKPLLEIAGQPMIQHVYARALSSRAERVIVATDDQRIDDVVKGFGGECLMTALDHPTGTDRLAEVADILGLAAEAIIVNVQGDEPLLPASAIHQVADMLVTHPEASIATLCEPIHGLSDIEGVRSISLELVFQVIRLSILGRIIVTLDSMHIVLVFCVNSGCGSLHRLSSLSVWNSCVLWSMTD